MPLEAQLRLFRVVFSHKLKQHAINMPYESIDDPMTWLADAGEWPHCCRFGGAWISGISGTDLGFQIIALENCFRKPWYLHAFQCHVKNELRLTLLIAEMAKELVKSLFRLISCNSNLVKIVLFSKIVSTWLCDVSSQDGWTLVFFFRQFFSDRLRLHRFIFWIQDLGSSDFPTYFWAQVQEYRFGREWCPQRDRWVEVTSSEDVSLRKTWENSEDE